MAESRFYAPSGWQGAGEAIQMLLAKRQEDELKRRQQEIENRRADEAERRANAMLKLQQDQERRAAEAATAQQRERDLNRLDAGAKYQVENADYTKGVPGVMGGAVPVDQQAANSVGSSSLYDSSLIRGTLPSRTSIGSLPTPQPMDEVPRPNAPDQPPPVPGVMTAPTDTAGGQNYLKPTATARETQRKQAIWQGVLTDPNSTPQQKIAALYESAGAGNPPSQLLEAPTKPVFRTDPTRKVIQQQMPNGTWQDHKGDLPRDYVMLQEPQQSPYGPVSLDPTALAAYVQLMQAGTVQPNLTRSNAGVMNAALNSIAGQGQDAVTDLSTARAEFQADARSLANITGSLNTITAFEGLANRNIATLKDTLKQLPDSGLKVLNAPLRSVLSATGDTSTAAFRAALAPVQSEVARILAGSPSLTGVTTVSGQEEVRAMLPADYTVAQFLAALPVLQKDMKGRGYELQAMKTQITAGMKGRGQKRTPAAPGAAKGGGVPGAGDGSAILVDSDGNVISR